ncbi:PREDICTED: probable pectinesterase/pectinesterase inhibitor 54 [Tarenaya hassleriana]|uniref:probable pectinesterase/pectinesterase inhibitor 54 n=1 Tax=Tarenaya hassleriana TaxID=28532 RepID=UPI00053C5C23|nr:PREDICTED: probable pectinesterase/pectinesterase inhibitor 54 [Tarenaya hassleriana]
MGIADFALFGVLMSALIVDATRSMPFAYRNRFRRQCSQTLYPSLCVQSLQEFGYGARGFELVSLIVNKTISDSEKLTLSSQLVSLEDSEYTSLLSVSDSCGRFMKMSTKRLNQAMEALNELPSSRKRRRSIKDDVTTWLSAAMTFQQACKDSASSGDISGEASAAMISRIAQMMDHLSRHVSNSLALVDRVKVKSRKRSKSTVFPRWVSTGERRLLGAPTSRGRVHAVVAKDGSGDFRTVADAIAAAPREGRIVIYVKAGIYKEKVNIERDDVTLIGDGKDRTVFVGGDSVAGGASMPDSATFTVTGDGFIGRDIGFKNTAGPMGQQAIALSIASDRSVLYRCSISGYQDTLYTVALRQFYRECDIYGTVDFIFGNAAAIFQHCNLILGRPYDTRAYNVIMANGRTDPKQNTGFSLQNCKITTDSQFSPVKRRYSSYLGRPWKAYSRCIVMETYIDEAISGEGWVKWLNSGSDDEGTLYFGEYKNYGGGAGLSERVKWRGFHVMRFEDAMEFSVGEFIDGDSWLPNTGISFTPRI